MKKRFLALAFLAALLPSLAMADCEESRQTAPEFVAAARLLKEKNTLAAQDYVSAHEARTADYLRRRRTMSDCLSQLGDFNIAGALGLSGLPDIMGMLSQAATRAVCGTVDTTMAAIRRPIDQTMMLPGRITTGVTNQITSAGSISSNSLTNPITNAVSQTSNAAAGAVSNAGNAASSAFSLQQPARQYQQEGYQQPAAASQQQNPPQRNKYSGRPMDPAAPPPNKYR